MGTEHVEHLSGSDQAKLRLSMFLKTLLGELSVAEACTELAIGESRFHALRASWMQEALQLLEPRPMGRPPHGEKSAEAQRIAELETSLKALHARLNVTETREKITRILMHPPSDRSERTGKKGDPRVERLQRWRRRQQQRQRRSVPPN